MRLLWLLWLLLTPAVAQVPIPPAPPPPEPLKWLAKIDWLLVQDDHLISRPWSGRFEAYNGDAYDVTALYASRRPLVNLQGGLEVYRRGAFKTSLNLHYDNGFAAPLYAVGRYVGLGFSAYWTGPRSALAVHVLDALQSGGHVTERPCRDGLNRRFHCGSGRPWSEVAGTLDGRQIEPHLQLRWLHRF